MGISKGRFDMDNNDVKKFVAEAKTPWLPEGMWMFILNNYSSVPVKNGLAVEYKGLPWKRVCLAGSDWKYGSFYICPEKMLRRGVTFNEFYGKGTVD